MQVIFITIKSVNDLLFKGKEKLLVYNHLNNYFEFKKTTQCQNVHPQDEKKKNMKDLKAKLL